MTTMTIMNKTYNYEQQIMKEKRKKLACTECRICRKIIGDKEYVVFEERYFHAECLKQVKPVTA